MLFSCLLDRLLEVLIELAPAVLMLLFEIETRTHDTIHTARTYVHAHTYIYIYTYVCKYLHTILYLCLLNMHIELYTYIYIYRLNYTRNMHPFHCAEVVEHKHGQCLDKVEMLSPGRAS